MAIEIFRRLLASNPDDNIDARYHILALHLGLNPDYENQFLPDSGPLFGLDASKLMAKARNPAYKLSARHITHEM